MNGSNRLAFAHLAYKPAFPEKALKDGSNAPIPSLKTFYKKNAGKICKLYILSSRLHSAGSENIELS